VGQQKTVCPAQGVVGGKHELTHRHEPPPTVCHGQQWLVSYPKEDPKHVIAQQPFAHGETTNKMNYARLHGTPSIPLSRQTLFGAISKDWLKEFDFFDPKSYRELLWDDSNIYRIE
jgi:hypothetical protein